MRGKIQLIPCTIHRGGFSSERTFEIQLPDGKKLVGTADAQHLLDEQKEPLHDDDPEFGEPVTGFVKCRILRADNRGVLVEVPSADVIHVSQNDLVESD